VAQDGAGALAVERPADEVLQFLLGRMVGQRGLLSEVLFCHKSGRTANGRERQAAPGCL
jgi:hypothetical protein